MVNGMHVYGWPISSKVAITDWDKRRKDGTSLLGRNQRGADRSKGTRDSSTSLDVRGKGYQTFVSNSERSYAEAVYGHQNYDQFRDSKKADKNVKISWLERKEEREWISRCAIGTLYVFSNYDGARKRLKDRGYSVKTSYLGDNHILWCFETKTDRDGFLANRFFWEDCFSSMNKWNVSYISKSKLVWIECYEIPLFCWNSNFFLKLGGIVGESLLVEVDTAMKKSLDRGRVLVLKDPPQEVPHLIKIQKDHGIFPVKLSKDQIPVDISWVKQHLGIYNEDLNLNPLDEMERVNSLEDLEDVTVRTKSQEKDKRKMGVAGQVRKVVREKSSSLDTQSNHSAWARGEVKEDRGGFHNLSDINGERNLKVSYSLKSPKKGKGNWVRKSKVKPLGFPMNNTKLVIGKSRSDMRRGESKEESSWTSSEAESREFQKQ
ncbi:hypothetical protein LWI28_014588 [Acer negundo]|uniref:DUF4283 domain-containing protein n=1 Tax=Acer negundo TaxID=4023 RepID=A0AAD5IAG9_ACENE|nr:hypothetical protein LWI28_014588 [Acer negundo]